MKSKTGKKQINESKGRIMPSKYLIRFKNRIINARQGAPGDVEEAVKEFYKMYGRKIQNPDFTLENLMKLAERIQGEGGSENIIGNGRHMGQNGSDSWWGMNMGGQMEEEAIPINESDLRAMVKECVKRILSEGFASSSLKKMAKEHGGILNIDKSMQLDKLDVEFDNRWGQNSFVVLSDKQRLPNALEQFIDYYNPVVTFKDLTCICRIKPEYMTDKRVKNMIAKYQQESAELLNKRNAGIEPETYYDDEMDDEGRWRSYKQTRSPEQVRQGRHKRARGVKKPEAIGNSADYDKYVERYLCQKYNGKAEHEHTKWYDDDDKNDKILSYIIVPINAQDGGFEKFYWGTKEGQDMSAEFEKYGYGVDEYKSNKNQIAFKKGESVGKAEIDDKMMYPDYFMPLAHKIDSPKIGTKDFNKKKQVTR